MAFRLLNEYLPQPAVAALSPIVSTATATDAVRIRVFMFSLEAQQLNSDFGGVRSFHPGVKDDSGRPPLSEIKLLRSDTADLEAHLQAIKRQYEQYFGT